MNLCRYRVAVAVILVACASTSHFQVSHAHARQPPTDEQLIRDARARSNAAIRAHDPVAMARLWMDDVHVVRSTGAQVAGRERNQQRMAQQFATHPDTIYVRNPSAIDVYLPWAMASERGDWTARWTETRRPRRHVRHVHGSVAADRWSVADTG